MVETISEILRGHPLFADLPTVVVDTAVGCAKNVAFEPGELLSAGGQGRESPTLYLLRRGSVAIEVHAPGRGGLVVQTLGPGKVVGWSWLDPPLRWSFDARAVTPVGAVAVDPTCLWAKADGQPSFGYALMRRISAVLVEQLHGSLMQLVDLYGHGDDL